MMRIESGPVSRAIAGRRSIRSFDSRDVDAEAIQHLVTLACSAPAPHHSQPWRFVHVTSADARIRLSDAMTDNWRSDLEREGKSVHEIAKLLRRSQEQISDAPVLVLACLTLVDARSWTDREHRVAERDMFVQSLGAALQNLLLAAGECGLVGYLKGAPLFCAHAIREALHLPSEWEPTFLVLLGYPEEGAVPPVRITTRIEDFLIER